MASLISLISLLILAPQAIHPPLPSLALDSFPPAARDAIAPLHREAVARPGSTEAVAALARVLHAWELWDAAHQAYARAQSLDPRAFEWRYLDALVLQRLARHTEAAAQLRQALATVAQGATTVAQGFSPATYLPARVKLAEALLEAGRLDESKELFGALVQEPAAEPIAQLGLGRIAAAEGRHDAAIGHLEKAVALFPEFSAAHYALARAYRARGREDEARRARALHEQYGSRWPAIEDGVLARVLALREDPRAEMQRGMKLAERGDVPGAIAAHEAALARDPSLAQAHENLISLYGRAGKWAKAEEHYRAAVARGANLADVHYDYGVLLALQEKWDSAAEAYRQALAVNPLHAPARNNLGQIHERQRRFEDAAAAYRQALDGQPAFRLARFNLGRMLIALDRPAEAVSELEKVVEPKDAEAPRYVFALGVALVRSGRQDEGIKWVTEARRLALEFGQHDLAAAIDRDLASLARRH